MVGETISHYKVLEKIGQGGMGTVYRAQDTTLDREVAIKVLPEQFTQDPQRLARFEREAKLLAQLNHPNIAAIHSFEHADDIHFLVLELVPGETLAERVAKGPLPVEEALEVCRQIAEGVEAAHEKGVIHRDLKPANVKVTPEGKVKILDFGLAKAFEAETPVTDISQSPTLTAGMTRAGVILGTAAYMSPEQAKGKPVDKRADIFAFGAVLYELLTGKRAFHGETITETIAAVLKSEPDWEKLPNDTPWNIRNLLRRCLHKDSQDRFRDIGDARIEIKETLFSPSSPWPVAPAMETSRGWQRMTPWILAGAIALVAIIWSLWQPAPSDLPPVTRTVIRLPPDAPLEVETWRPALALSPDSSRLVYVANRSGKRQLYLREMDQLQATPIPGTEGGSNPFFSPDGQWVGYFVGGTLKKVSLSGGLPVTLSVVPPVTRGATWGSNDQIIFTTNPNGGLSQVSAAGGTPQDLSTPDSTKGEFSHRWPQILPGGKAVLFTIDTGGSFDDARIAVLSLETGEKRVLVDGGTNARYSPTGHIVFARGGSLLAVPFDLEGLNVTGEPAVVIEDVMMEPGGAVHLTVSDQGMLIYVPGGTLVPNRKLVWVNCQGEFEPLPVPAREYKEPSVSPDGQRVAVTIREGSNYDIWISEVARGTLTRLTSHPGEDGDPTWTPDGKRVTFSSEMTGNSPTLWWRPADGSGPAEELLKRDVRKVRWPRSWVTDSQILVFTEWDRENGDISIWLLDVEDKGDPRPFLRTEFDEFLPMLSPDSSWISYISDESGQDEVYVQAFPGGGGRWQVSVGGGSNPVWAPNGREIFYRNGDKMMAVAIDTESEFSAGAPQVLFEGRFYSTEWVSEGRSYDISPDGQRFLMIKREQDPVPTELIVVLNWYEELKRLVPPGE